MNLSDKDIKRFWSHVDIRGDDECWNWNGKHDGKYHNFSVGGKSGKSPLSHRIAYELTHGDIPSGLVIRHTCNNPSCCNPSHLITGTTLENVHDEIDSGTFQSGDRHWSRMHPEKRAFGKRNARTTHPETTARGERNGSTKLTQEQVREIRQLRKKGLFQHIIAKMFGVHQATIWRVEHYKNWRE